VKLLDMIKSGAATVTDHLAAVGERMPGLAQLTVSIGGVTATVVPKPPAPPPPAPTCPACGGPKP
jgi:hypothetical protein